MTMAPGRKKRGFLLEIILISILLFLLLGSRSQRMGAAKARSDFKLPLQRALSAPPAALR
jgi:Tfp pilus assembly protein PilX